MAKKIPVPPQPKTNLRHTIFIGLSIACVVGLLILAVSSTGAFTKLFKNHTPTQARSPKLLILGIDGGDWSIIDPLVNEGKMPNLKKLMDEGVTATPKTLNPTISPAIWTTVATGKVPEKHSVRNFIMTASDYEPRFVSSDVRQSKALWNIFNANGWTTGLFSWWATWPPENIKGYVVTDLAVLDPKSGITPPELVKGIEANAVMALGLDALNGGLSAELPTPTSVDDPNFFAAAYKQISALDTLFTRNSLFAYDKYKPDTLMQIFGGADAAQHLFLKFQFPDKYPLPVDPNLLARYKNFIQNLYIHQDQMIGEYIKRAGPETNILVLSDHGAFIDPAVGYRFTKFNTLLSHLGLLTYTPDGQIDFTKTSAFECNNNTFDWQRRLCLNVQGKFSNGTISPNEFEKKRAEIITKLQSIKTNSGEPLFLSVTKSAELTNDVAYDIRRDLLDSVILVGDTYRTVKEYLSLSIESGNHYSNPTGPDGFFVWKGPNIKKGVSVSIDYVDIAPNILYALGLPIAKDMDGVWRSDLFIDRDQPTYIDTYEIGIKQIPISRVESFEADDIVQVTNFLVDISSTVSKGDSYDRVCFSIPNAEQYSIETKKLQNDTSLNPTFATQNIKDLTHLTNKNIALSSLAFANGEEKNYQLYTPLEFGKESYLGIWTNAQASFEMPTDGYLHIVARATPANGEWPILHLIQNQQDTPLSINTNAATVYTVKLSQGNVQLQYGNDAKNASEDRNIYIQRMYVDNSPTQQLSSNSNFTRENDDVCFENSLPGTTLGSFLFSPITSNTQHPSASQDAIKFLEESGEIQEE